MNRQTTDSRSSDRPRWKHAALAASGNAEPPKPPPLPDHCDHEDDLLVRAQAPPLGSDVTDVDQLTHLHLADRGHHADVQRESAGWASSVVVHLAVLLGIAFLVAPQDRGGSGLRTLHFSFSPHDGDLQGPLAAIEIDVPEEQPEPEPAEPESEPESAEVEEVELKNTAAFSGSGDDSSDEAERGARNSDAAHGSFFGIESPGQEFVYVLDMSGSMKGLRFRRAAAELIRSVNQLESSQKFYVFLFSNGAVPMFGQASLSPSCIAATFDNKRRLKNWLDHMSPVGGTDPRRALHTAVRMNPSVIFMLSDGEFNDDNDAIDVGMGDTGDTFSMLKAMRAQVPIHSIAYEDPQSRGNMEKLAEMTGGEFRFVRQSRAAGNELLAAAKLAIKIPDASNRLRHLNEISDAISSAKMDQESLTEFATVLMTHATKALSTGSIVEARNAFAKSVQSDRFGQLDQRYIDEFLDLYESRLAKISITQRTRLYIDLIAKSKGQSGQDRLANRIGKRLLDNAVRCQEAGQYFQAYDIYYAVMRSCGNTQPALIAKRYCLQFEASVTENSRLAYEAGNIELAIRELRSMVERSKRSNARNFVLHALRSLTETVLIDTDLARAVGERQREAELLSQLKDGYEGDRLLNQITIAHKRRMRDASKLVSKANLAVTARDWKTYETTVEALASQYSKTVAGRLAVGKLKKLKQNRVTASMGGNEVAWTDSSLYFPE